MAAKSKPVDEVMVSDLGLSADEVGWDGARQEIVAVEPAPAREAGEKVVDEGDAHERIIQFLEERKVI
jgi:electron transfer flavoprotein beta subunit